MIFRISSSSFEVSSSSVAIQFVQKLSTCSYRFYWYMSVHCPLSYKKSIISALVL